MIGFTLPRTGHGAFLARAVVIALGLWIGLLAGVGSAQEGEPEAAVSVEEIETRVKPVLEGKPVTELAEEDRRVLFLAEQFFPDSFNLFFRHGEYLASEKNDYSQAIPRLKKALELSPGHTGTLELLARCFQELKQAADEVSCWESLRELVEDGNTADGDALKERVLDSLERMARDNGMLMRQGKRFILYTPTESEWDHVPAELSDARLEDVYGQITGDLACVPPFRTSILVLTPQKFDEVKPVSWAGGFAAGGKSMTVPADRFPKSDPDRPLPAKTLVLHEFTHNIVHYAGGGRCPTWLNEGLAGFAERKDDTWHEFKPLTPAEVAMAANPPSIRELEEEFARLKLGGEGSPAGVGRVYLLFYLYARFLVERTTMAGPRQLINSLRGGLPQDEGFPEATGMTRPQFEAEFKAWAKGL